MVSFKGTEKLESSTVHALEYNVMLLLPQHCPGTVADDNDIVIDNGIVIVTMSCIMRNVYYDNVIASCMVS